MQRDNRYDFIKGIAVFCVFAAHTGNRQSLSVLDSCLDVIRNNIGVIGVPLFFIISGFFFSKKDRNLFELVKSKSNILIPWLFWGSIVWLYEVMRKGLEYAKLWEWLLGIGTYLWYLPTLFICYFLFAALRKTSKRIVICCFAFLLAYRVFAYDLLILEKCTLPFVGNFLYYGVFFALGYLLKEAEINIFTLWSRVTCYKKIFLAFMLGVSIFISVYINDGIVKFSDSKLFFIYIIAVGMILLLFIDLGSPNYWLYRVNAYMGKNSLFAYLIHMPFAGIVSNLFSRNRVTLLLVAFQPVLVFGCVLIICIMFHKIFGKSDWLCYVLGIKRGGRSGE